MAGFATHHLLVACVVVVMLCVVVGSSVWLHKSGIEESDKPGPHKNSEAFVASDFKLPELLTVMNAGTLKNSLRTEEAVLILYYIKEMNDVFGDSTMNLFLSPDCFTKVHDAEMTARLQSVFLTKVVPQGMMEILSIASDKGTLPESLRKRYPIFSRTISDVIGEGRSGSFDQAFLLVNLPKILKAKARQDSITLFDETRYGCNSDVTKRIYASASQFVKSYRLSSTH